MSTEKRVRESLLIEGQRKKQEGTIQEERDPQQTELATSASRTVHTVDEGERSLEIGRGDIQTQPTKGESFSHEPIEIVRHEESGEPTRQVIAVSASKGPAAFFNLARKFLATDETCDLSALEGAIVSAVDAAHLLERSQLATIVRVNTSYVTVEPKRRKQATQSTDPDDEGVQAALSGSPSTDRSTISSPPEPLLAKENKPQVETQQSREGSPFQHGVQTPRQSGGRGPSGRELRRARIVITVRRTESYKRWLEENPLQAIITSDSEAVDAVLAQTPGELASKKHE